MSNSENKQNSKSEMVVHFPSDTGIVHIDLKNSPPKSLKDYLVPSSTGRIILFDEKAAIAQEQLTLLTRIRRSRLHVSHNSFPTSIDG